ncbi:LysE type translocator [Pelotomaculum sp. FP]|uniref:LysE family translocator n=1 Tax=Pelotomaculum sp. FP TaxID=261474 RepID=UPI001066089C|nr:LysE family transporter [Pelotomaculum sp. FP]TEB12469.1 LysE type translocator [Pelotomaculum sp. FP]
MKEILFLKAVVIGFFLAVPIGPVNLLCIRRTLLGGRIIGFISGLGAAVADTFFAFAAAFGLSFITNFYVQEEKWLQFGGGIFICVLGVMSMLSHEFGKPEKKNGGRGRGGFQAFISSFFLTLTNPITILAFAAAFAGFGLINPDEGHASAFLVVTGVFLGSIIWWFTISSIASFLRKKLNSHVLHRITQISGLVITVFGVLILLGVI